MSHFNESPLQSEAQQNIIFSLRPGPDGLCWSLCKMKTKC